ncbi:MAG: hypothetical protein AAGD01_14975 [Acidobacteriota bacterium]
MTEASSLDSSLPRAGEQLVLPRPAGTGWFALLGGGDSAYGETFDADLAWLAKIEAGVVGFLPTASGSMDYHRQLASYFHEELGRALELIPVYRGRDVRRRPHLERIATLPATYLGGGVADMLLETLRDSPVLDALKEGLEQGRSIIATAASARAFGAWALGLGGDEVLPGFGWLRGGVLETVFEPEDDERLRQLLKRPGARWALGLPAGSAALLAPSGEVEVVGEIYYLDAVDGDFRIYRQEPSDGVLPPLPLDPREG